MGVDVPDELIVEILSRLPAKSVIRFRCVCKTWCNLTTDSSFTQLHHTRAIEIGDLCLLSIHYEHLSELGSTFAHTDDEGNVLWYEKRLPATYFYCVERKGNSLQKPIKIKDPLNTFYGSCRVLGSCNGVVCLGRYNRVCLINPYTREYKIVEFDKDFGFKDNCCYDDEDFFFGYDITKEDYTLVQFVSYDNRESYINVYSFGDTSCSKISNVPYRNVIAAQSGTFLNGALHWVVGHKYKFSELIIYVDIGEKVVREIPRPDNVARDADDVDSRAYLTLGIVEGQLALLIMYFAGIIYVEIEIWVMKNYGAWDSWCKLFSTKTKFVHSVNNPCRSFCFDSMSTRPLYFTKDAEVLLKVEVPGKLGKYLVMYDLKKKSDWYLGDLGSGWYDRYRIVTHVASLVPLKSGSYVGADTGVEEEEHTQ